MKIYYLISNKHSIIFLLTFCFVHKIELIEKIFMFMKTKIDIQSNCIISNVLSKTRYEIVFEIFKKGGTKLKYD